jgi:hypothetical protein
MNPNSILDQISRMGFVVSIEGDRLAVRPPGKLTPALRQAISEHKTAIMDFLKDATTGREATGAPLDASPLSDDLPAHRAPGPLPQTHCRDCVHFSPHPRRPAELLGTCGGTPSNGFPVQWPYCWQQCSGYQAKPGYGRKG